MNKIKTYEDACAALKIDPNTLPDVSSLIDKDQKSLLAHYKLIKIAEALNGGWEPEWTNYREYKYFPYFDMDDKSNAAGFGFSYDDWAGTDSDAGVGSRLCFKTSTLAEYAGKKFTDLYREMMTGK